eukprot:m.21107 g.21107  ORF g.21107 m.21107 type:complete len:190 (+) comp11096_c0_seq1:66-635(+)
MSQDNSRINVALDQLIDNVDSVRQALYIFTSNLQKNPLPQWDQVLSHFGEIQGRINALLKYVASDRLPKLHNRLVLPQRLTADLDEHLQAVTENRLQRFTHDDAPLYLRTKLVPELEEIDSELEQAAESQLTDEQVAIELQQLNETVLVMQQELLSKRKLFEAKQAGWSRPAASYNPNPSLSTMAAALL